MICQLNFVTDSSSLAVNREPRDSDSTGRMKSGIQITDNWQNLGKARKGELPAKWMNGGECVHSFPHPTLDTVPRYTRTTAVPTRNDMACKTCVLYVRETKGWQKVGWGCNCTCFILRHTTYCTNSAKHIFMYTQK